MQLKNELLDPVLIPLNALYRRSFGISRVRNLSASYIKLLESLLAGGSKEESCPNEAISAFVISVLNDFENNANEFDRTPLRIERVLYVLASRYELKCFSGVELSELEMSSAVYEQKYLMDDATNYYGDAT